MNPVEQDKQNVLRCPVCNSDWIDFVDRYMGGYKVLECNKCGQRFKNEKLHL